MLKWRRKKKEAAVEEPPSTSSVELHQGKSDEVDAVLVHDQSTQGVAGISLASASSSVSSSKKKVSEKSSASLLSNQMKPDIKDHIAAPAPRRPFVLWRKKRAKKVVMSQMSVQSSKKSLSTSSTAQLSHHQLEVAQKGRGANIVFGMIEASDEPIEWNETDHAVVQSNRATNDLSQAGFDSHTQDASSPTEKHRNQNVRNSKLSNLGPKRGGGLQDRDDLNAILSDSSNHKERKRPMTTLKNCRSLSEDSWSTITESYYEDGGESLDDTLMTESLAEDGDQDTLLSESILDSDEGSLNTFWDHDSTTLRSLEADGCQGFDRAMMKAWDARCIDGDLGDDSLDGRKIHNDEIFVLAPVGDHGRRFQKVV